MLDDLLRVLESYRYMQDHQTLYRGQPHPVWKRGYADARGALMHQMRLDLLRLQNEIDQERKAAERAEAGGEDTNG